MNAAILAIVSGLAGAAIGAVAGFYFRAAEFRRERRMAIYADFAGAFITAGHEGAGAYSLWVQYGDTLFTENRKMLAELWPVLASAVQRFELETARLRMVGSRGACDVADRLEDFINQNVRHIPPMRQTVNTDEWGEAARVGPSKVDSETVRLAREFAEQVRADLSARKLKVDQSPVTLTVA